MAAYFSDITERGGEAATHGQIADMFNRYRWASLSGRPPGYAGVAVAV